MEKIKEIVANLAIEQKRAKVLKNKKEMLNLSRQMSALTFNINVAKYAYNLDTLRYKQAALVNASEEEQKKILLDIERIKLEQDTLEIDDNVQEYIRLLTEYQKLDQENKDFHRLINETLRTELLDLDLPEIFVHQGLLEKDSKYHLYRHLIAHGTYISSPESPDQTIYPSKEVTSNRRSRHYYNKISYKYLDQLTKDYNFDVPSKKLGKVKILSRGIK